MLECSAVILKPGLGLLSLRGTPDYTCFLTFHFARICSGYRFFTAKYDYFEVLHLVFSAVAKSHRRISRSVCSIKYLNSLPEPHLCPRCAKAIRYPFPNALHVLKCHWSEYCFKAINTLLFGIVSRLPSDHQYLIRSECTTS